MESPKLKRTIFSFLTRTGMWISWEVGVEHFLKHLLDADWSVCAGNWMWVSSSAFEKLLDSSKCNIVPFGKRLDPKGVYIKRYVPELRGFPVEFIHQPWTSPRGVQEDSKCIIGQHYPSPIIDLVQASQLNCSRMKSIREALMETQPHVRPSNEEEIRNFFWIADDVNCN